MSGSDTLSLGGEFPPATREAWLKLVDGVLKGDSFDRLKSRTADGIVIEPIYPRAADAKPIAGRPATVPWQVMQRIDQPDPVAANRQALDDLEGGATGLTLVFAEANGAAGYGLPPTAEAVERALREVHLDAVAIELQIGPQSRDAASHLASLITKRGFSPGNCDIRFGLDPIGAAAVWGSSPYAWAEIAPALSGAAKNFAALGFKGPFAAADGRVIHDAGGSEAQELAFTLAVMLAYLRALESAGIALDDARGMVYARLAADADQFLTMAKFRSLRLLWARVEQSCGLASKPLFIAAETAWRMMSARDSDVNMLRTTMATFAAGLAGANSIAVLPHTLPLGLPDPLARRIARNTQVILLEESNLARVTDPAAGAGGIEELTAQLTAAAWTQFQAIEKAGGAFAALESGLIQREVTKVREARNRAIALRRNVITGVSEFANLNEKAMAVLNATPVKLPAYGAAKYKFEALTPHRLAEPFEALRDKSDALLKSAGKRPQVFLASMGVPAEFTARLNFTKSFFEAGGIEAPDNDGFWEIPTMIHYFKLAKTPIACICASDAVYATNAADAAKALREAGATQIYLAGRGGDNEAAWKAAGIDEFVFTGCDALATLNRVYDRLTA